MEDIKGTIIYRNALLSVMPTGADISIPVKKKYCPQHKDNVPHFRGKICPECFKNNGNKIKKD